MSEPRGHWSSNTGLILAATGSAIGLGNLWKFPFVTWENNGGAFVLVYLVCIAAVGLPIMMAELLIGRAPQKSVVGALKQAIGPAWGIVGLWGVLCFAPQRTCEIETSAILHFGSALTMRELCLRNSGSNSSTQTG